MLSLQPRYYLPPSPLPILIAGLENFAESWHRGNLSKEDQKALKEWCVYNFHLDMPFINNDVGNGARTNAERRKKRNRRSSEKNTTPVEKILNSALPVSAMLQCGNGARA